MDWSSIITALIAAVGVGVTTIYSNHKNNNLILYRIEQLEKKVEPLHSNLQQRVVIAEQKLDRIENALEKLTDRASVHGEQIDSVYTLAEKNEARIQSIEKEIGRRM